MGNETINNKAVLKSNLCDCNDVHMSVRGHVTVTAAPSTQVSLKNVNHLLNLLQKLMEQQ